MTREEDTALEQLEHVVRVVATRLENLSEAIDVLEKTVPSSRKWTTHEDQNRIVQWFYRWIYVSDFAVECRTGERRHFPHHAFVYPFSCAHGHAKESGVRYTGESIDDGNACYQKLIETEKVEALVGQLDMLDRALSDVHEQRLKELVQEWSIHGHEPNQRLEFRHQTVSRPCTSFSGCICGHLLSIEFDSTITRLSCPVSVLVYPAIEEDEIKTMNHTCEGQGQIEEESLDQIKRAWGLKHEALAYDGDDDQEDELENRRGCASTLRRFQQPRKPLVNSTSGGRICHHLVEIKLIWTSSQGYSSTTVSVSLENVSTSEGRINKRSLWQELHHHVGSLVDPCIGLFVVSQQQLIPRPSALNTENHHDELPEIMGKGPESTIKLVFTALEYYDHLLLSTRDYRDARGGYVFTRLRREMVNMKEGESVVFNCRGTGCRSLHLMVVFQSLRAAGRDIIECNLSRNDFSSGEAFAPIIVDEIQSGCLKHLNTLNLEAAMLEAEVLILILEALVHIPTIQQVKVSYNDVSPAVISLIDRINHP